MLREKVHTFTMYMYDWSHFEFYHLNALYNIHLSLLSLSLPPSLCVSVQL